MTIATRLNSRNQGSSLKYPSQRLYEKFKQQCRVMSHLWLIALSAFKPGKIPKSIIFPSFIRYVELTHTHSESLSRYRASRIGCCNRYGDPCSSRRVTWYGIHPNPVTPAISRFDNAADRRGQSDRITLRIAVFTQIKCSASSAGDYFREVDRQSRREIGGACRIHTDCDGIRRCVAAIVRDGQHDNVCPHRQTNRRVCASDNLTAVL